MGIRLAADGKFNRNADEHSAYLKRRPTTSANIRAANRRGHQQSSVHCPSRGRWTIDEAGVNETRRWGCEAVAVTLARPRLWRNKRTFWVEVTPCEPEREFVADDRPSSHVYCVVSGLSSARLLSLGCCLSISLSTSS